LTQFTNAITLGKKAIAIASLAAGIVVGTSVSALAVTNPAVNPNPITVLGDDGNTYIDGQDTLPGFDDEECTYIPGAYFDFAANRVRYADGQSIAWTEWERATGYQEWLASQNNGSKTSPTAKPTASGGTTSGAGNGNGASTSAKTTAAVKNANKSTGTAADNQASSTGDDTSKIAGAGSATGLTPEIDGVTSTDTAQDEALSSVATGTLKLTYSSASKSENPGRVAGLTILGALLAAGLLLLASNFVRVRLRKETR